MKKNDFFNWLIKYHLEEHLERWLEEPDGNEEFYRLNKGHLLTPKNGDKPVPEGHENNEYLGRLFISGEHDLFERMMEPDPITNEPDIEPECVDLPVRIGRDQDNFLDFLANNNEEDGVFIEKGDLLYRVVHVKVPTIRLNEKVPPNFVYSDGKGPYMTSSQGINMKVGNRTRLQFGIPHKYKDAVTVNLKQSAYGKVGLGPVHKADKWGLSQTFFLDHFSTEELPAETKRRLGSGPDYSKDCIIGILRNFRPLNGRVRQAGQDILKYLNIIQRRENIGCLLGYNINCSPLVETGLDAWIADIPGKYEDTTFKQLAN